MIVPRKKMSLRHRQQQEEDQKENRHFCTLDYLSNLALFEFKMLCHNELHAAEEEYFSYYHLIGNNTGHVGEDFNAFMDDTIPNYCSVIINGNSADVIEKERQFMEKEKERIKEKLRNIPPNRWTNCIKGQCYCYKQKIKQHVCPMDIM